MKICPRCGNSYDDSFYHKSSKNKDGLSCYCKTCTSEATRVWRKANRERVNANARQALKSPEQRLRMLLYRNGAKVDRRQLSFEVMWDRLQDTDFCCEVTGIPFVFDVPKHPCAMSIDRINPGESYTHDNVRLVCWWLNCAMGNWGLQNVETFLKEWGWYKDGQI